MPCMIVRRVSLEMAQLALSMSTHPDLRTDGGIQAGAGCRVVLDAGELEPAQVVIEIFGCDPAPPAQESLDPLVQAVDGLDMQFATDPLAELHIQTVNSLHERICNSPRTRSPTDR